VCTSYIGTNALPSPKLNPRWALVSKTTKLWACSQLSTLKGVEGHAKAPGWD